MRTTKRLYRKYHVRQAIMYFLAVWTIFATVPFAWADVNPASNALPNGILPGTTVGAGNFDRTVLNKLTINNVQNGAVVNWNNFDIGSAATVQINQASASAAMLNRVFDGNPTGIMGTLNANGRVFIINPAGVLFGAGSSVNVNQLIASSLNLTDAAFLNGINTGQFNFEGGIPGVDPSQKIGIINNGTITGTEGIALIGQKILNNGAIVTSNGGCVVMAAGDKVVLSQPGSKVIVEMASSTSDIEGAGSVVNNTTGSITSPGGQIVLAAGDIYSAALNNDSKAVKVDGGNGRVGQFGTINAGSGSVSLTAGDVVALGSDSKTTANAGTNGDGGEIVAYSPDTALFHDGAVVEAKGGSQSGNGGFFELSGKEYVEVEGQIDLTAQNGQFGTFLIDPRNITISGGSNNHGSIPSSGAPRTWSPTGSNATLNIDSLESYLGSSNVIVSTAVSGSDSGWIKLDAGRNLVYGGSNYLTLKADDYILINSGINFSGSGNVTLDAVTNITTNAAISLNSGLFTAHAGNSTTDSSAGILSINQNITAGSILLTAGNQNGFDSGTCRVYVGYAPVSDEEYHPGTGTFSNVSLTSTLGDIVVRAIHDIFIGGNVQSAGKISLTGDVEGAAGYPEFGGDIITKGNVTASGGVDYMANAIAIGGNVSANGGNLVIEGRSSKDSASAADDPRGTILDPGAEWGDITVASGGKLYASGDVSIIDYSIDHYSKPASVGKMKLTGNTLLTIQAGNKITAPDTVISVTGSTLVMQQGASLNTADYLFANQANTNLTLISDNGSVTSTTGANAADKWHSIGATADSDITLSGNGSITLGDSGTDATKSLWAKNGNINVTAAGAGNDILATKDLTAGSALTVEADRDITLGGAVTTSVVTNGDLKIDADADTDSSGNIHAKSTITNMGGKIDISGVEVDLDGAVKAKNDILVSGVSGGDMGHVNAYGPLTSENGKIDVFSDWYINLYGAVDAYTDLILKADTSMYGDSHINAYSTLTAQTGNMEISAEGSENLQVSVKLGDVVTAGKNMTLNADLDNYGFGVLDAQELIAGGSINIYSSDSTTNLHDDVTAGADIILHNNTEADGGIKLDAGQDAVLADGKTLNGLGDLTVKAGHDVILGGDVTTVKDMTLNAGNDMIAKSNLTSTNGSIDIYSSDSTTYLGGDWVEASDNVTLNNNTKLNGNANQRIEAINGRVTAKGFLDKIYCGELHITGGEEEGLAVDLAKFVRANDNIYIKGNGDVQLSGKVTAGEDCINCEIEQGDFVTFVAQIVEECCGGVSIISENGMVYTADAGDALSVTVKGYSNDAKGQGVNLSGDPFNDKGLGKAAIIIISKDDLKLASGATLQAYGFYNTTGAVDDRAGVNFLDDVPPDEIPAGILRNKGVPFDVAIYLKSTGGKNPNAGQGNVTVDATVSIQSLGAGQKVCTNEGAMVIDAWDTVTFGDNFKSSIANGDVGNRLEVCSRITEWLEDAAVSPERLPYALDILNGNPLPLPFPPGYAYVLRGAGLENPDILLNFNNPDRAWVLVPSSFLVVDDVFSTSWRSGNVTGFDPASLDVLLNDGVKYQASVTDITVTTLGGTLAKVLLTDDGGATHYWGYIYTPPTDVPFVWNGVSDYASFGDTFEYQAEKVVNGVTIHSTNTATVTINVTNFLPVPGNADTTIHMVTTTNGALDAKFVLGTNPIITDIDGSPNPLVMGLGDGPTPHTGTPSISGNNVTYHPLDGYVTGGTPDSFEYTVNDESIVSATATPVVRTGTLKVAITDTLPIGSGQLPDTHMDTPLNNVSLASGGFTDAEGDTVTVGAGPYKGAVDGSTLYGGNLTTSGASYNYTPDTAEIPGYVGNDTFTVQLSDGQRNYVFDGSGNIVSNALVTSSGTVKVTLTDTLPSGGWTGTTHMDTPIINGAIPGGSFTDAEGDTVTVGSGPYKGAVDGSTLYGGNLTTSGASYNYTPDTAEIPGYVGNDKFTVQLSDGQRNYVFDGSGNIVSNALVTSSGTVKVTLTDTLPGGGGDLGSTPEGTALTVTQNGVSNPVGVVDQDNGLDTLSHIIGTYNGSAGGKLEFDGTKWIYTPAPGHVGSEEFTINVWDGQNKYMFEEGKISSVEPVYGNGTVTVTVTANEINPILPAAPLPVIRLPEISGCPELMGAVAMELGINPADIQVAIGNSLTDTPDTQPCEACKKVVNYAGILKDTQGQHMAAMVQVFNQLAPANTPYSPEMGAMIANAFADYKNNPDMPQYATAMEYIDAFVKYAKVLDTELGAPVGDSTAFVLEKYGSNLTKAGNENIYMYIQTQLGKSTGGPTASLSN